MIDQSNIFKYCVIISCICSDYGYAAQPPVLPAQQLQVAPMPPAQGQPTPGMQQVPVAVTPPQAQIVGLPGVPTPNATQPPVLVSATSSQPQVIQPQVPGLPPVTQIVPLPVTQAQVPGAVPAVVPVGVPPVAQPVVAPQVIQPQPIAAPVGAPVAAPVVAPAVIPAPAPIALPPVPQPVAVPAAAAPVAPIKVVGIQPPLSKNDLDNLSVEDKNKSDALLIQGLRKIANGSYTTLDFDNKKYLNAYEAYLAFIKAVLVDEVGNNAAFKLRQPLLDLVGQKDQLGGALQKFANDHLKINGSESQFLANIVKDSDSLISSFLALFKGCVFFDQTFNNQAAQYISYIFANLLDAQRTGQATDDLTKKQSNDLVIALVKLFRSSIQSEIDAQKPKSGIVNMQAIALSKDYIMWLADSINRLRLNPSFYRFNGLAPLLDMLACGKNCSVPNTTVSALAVDQLYKNFADLLLFDANQLQAVVPQQNPIWDAAIKDHERRISKS